MPVSKVELTGGQFQDCEGNLLSGGYLWLKLSQDETVNDSEICSGVEVKIFLDGYGSVIAGQYVWGNDQMLPVNSYYIVTGYTASGQPAWGPNNQQVFGNGGTFDVGTWIPNQVISWVPPLQPLNLEVNGTPLAAPQTLLNFTNSPTVTFTDIGGGAVSATASGGTILPAAANGPFFIGPGFMTAQIPGIVFGGVSSTANVIRISRFVLPIGMVVSRCSILATYPNAPGLCSFALYSADGSTKLVDSGTFTNPNSAAAWCSNTFTPVHLPAGVYWFAQTDSSGYNFWVIKVINSSDASFTGNDYTGSRNLAGTSSTISSVGVMPASISVTGLTYAADDTIAAPIWESQ